MPKTVFLSWQDDRPALGGRNFLERCLEKAIGSLGDETALTEAERELVVDRDTKGVSGSPNIVETIFKKIDDASVFVADMTFVGHRADGRPTPNPNVLIEYGRAQRSLGQDRIIAVINTAYGAPSEETLPFNLRHLRWPIQYDMPEDAGLDVRQAERDRLANVLRVAIRACLQNVQEPVATQPKLFVARQAESKPGLFRPGGTAIGLSDGSLRSGKEVQLSSGHAVWLRLMPEFDPGRTWGLTELREATRKPENHLALLVTGIGLSYVRGEDGFGVYCPHPSEEETCLVAYCFSTGELWAIDTITLKAWEQHEGKPIPWMKGEFHGALPRYGKCLTDLGIEPPLRWIAGMSGLKGRVLRLPNASPFSNNVCVSDTIEASGTFTPGDSAEVALKPFYDKLYESCGISV